MASAENVPTPEKPTKAHAAPPAERTARPPVDASALEHRNLRGGEFWREIPAFANVSEEEFLDYKWQMKNSLYGEDKLLELMDGLAPKAFVDDVLRGFHLAPMAVRVTPYLFSLIDWNDPLHDPIRTQFIPVASRLTMDHPMLTLDSLHEQADAPVAGLTHRYHDKALFLPLDTCPVYCRFCTRSYAIGVDTDVVEKVSLKVSPKRWEEAFAYIESRPELEDIVISGGDAYNLAFKHIEAIGMRLLAIPHIRRIRFATKGLAVMPMKILSDERWLDAVTRVAEHGRKVHKQVCIHTHFNNPNEITEISRRATNTLFERGITVRNQTVLQRGVNDSQETMRLLVKRLGEVNVEAYYVYQHDMVQGVEDLRTSLQTNLDIEKFVRGSTAGFNTPTFVVDAPGGGGKREAHSYEHYDRETGVSVYSAPSVKPGQLFTYFDPLHSLSDAARADWKDADKREQMVQDALLAARNHQGQR
ncbi:KamA family radical SAM protein [Lujinxingia litoralis]|uniref:KamA family radical SAM protein n=1 Tax=Lujinxingia litoralis TaxID=2211119 RepID=A0A328C5X0_9DELT|nr:KamA family radical SAM protein [Lujinxingia litoralis]RAL22222.1 KamA family radical SAM protein [Lujinxingia litoralis]